MKKQASGYTHGGSVGKNFSLLLRSVATIAAFSALWVGIAFRAEAFGIPVAIGGGALTALLVVANFVLPMLHRVR